MATVETFTRNTVDLLERREGRNVELVDGQLVEQNVSVLSSLVAATLLAAILRFARERKLGLAWGADLGIACYPDAPDKVRRPDVTFVSAERLTSELLDDSFLRIAPDLVVEVISPHDGASELERKIQEYLRAGVKLVWIIHPEQRTVRIHRAEGSIGWLTESGMLDGEQVLPGFCIPIRDLFPAEVPTPPLAAKSD